MFEAHRELELAAAKWSERDFENFVLRLVCAVHSEQRGDACTPTRWDEALVPLVVDRRTSIRSTVVQALRFLAAYQPVQLGNATHALASSVPDAEFESLATLVDLLVDARFGVSEETVFALCLRSKYWRKEPDLDVVLEGLVYLLSLSRSGAVSILALLERMHGLSVPMLLACEAAVRSVATLAPGKLTTALEWWGSALEQLEHEDLDAVKIVLADVLSRAGRRTLVDALARVELERNSTLFRAAFSPVRNRATFTLGRVRIGGLTKFVVLGEPIIEISSIVSSNVGPDAEAQWRDALQRVLDAYIGSIVQATETTSRILAGMRGGQKLL